MKPVMSKAAKHQAKSTFSALIAAVVFVGFLMVPGMVMAQDFGGADTKVCGFFSNIKGLLNIASIAAFPPGPFLAAYYGTKGYLLRWSEASPRNWRRAA